MKLWFRAKTYGWGWYPITWQGWLVILVWAVLFGLGITFFERRFPDHHATRDVVEYLVYVAIITSGLIYVCYKTGERPRWRWGRDKDGN